MSRSHRTRPFTLSGNRKHLDDGEYVTPGPRIASVHALLRLFPATSIVLAPYLALILPVAIVNSNPDLVFIWRLLGIAAGGSLLAETVIAVIRRSAAREVRPLDLSFGRPLRQLTLAVTAVSVFASLTYIITGAGSVASQIAELAPSVIASISTLFAAWNLFAAGLIFASYFASVFTRKQMLAGIAILVLLELIEAAVSTRVGSLIQFITPLALTALLLGVVRLRTLAAGFLLIALIWPLAFQLRNEMREGSGVAVDTSVSAFDRLRFDEQLAKAGLFDVPLEIGQPGLAEIVRYGLVPRALDPDRDTISSGLLLNQAIGGSTTSAYNFLSIGTIYVFYGPIVLFAFYALSALVVSLSFTAARRGSPIAICMSLLGASSLLGWASTFPDALIGYLQALVSFVPIAVSLHLIRAKARREARESPAVLEGS